MSINDAIVFHGEALAKVDEEPLADYRDAPATISTTFRIVEVEVPVLQLVTV